MGVASIIQGLRKKNRARLARRRTIAKCLEDERVKLVAYEHSPINVSIGASQPRSFHFRPSSKGDRGVIDQMFVSRDYDFGQWKQGAALSGLASRLSQKGVLPLIIDAGANIGAAAVYFQQSIAGAKLICVEPDSGNCQICRKNLEGTSAVLLENAISSSVGQVKLFDPGKGDWGFRTDENLDGEAGIVVPTTTIPQILDLYASSAEPFIVKIDIEGAESDLFSSNCDWMDLFPCIIIELHDWMLPAQGSSRSFFKQMVLRNYDVVYRGENMFLFNMGLIEERMKQHV